MVASKLSLQAALHYGSKGERSLPKVPVGTWDSWTLIRYDQSPDSALSFYLAGQTSISHYVSQSELLVNAFSPGLPDAHETLCASQPQSP